MTKLDEYVTTSKYYDASYTAKTNLVDLPFYIPLAENDGGPILEIGCGTGRVLLPIARKGIRITGVDQSESMLSVLRSKLKDEEPSVQANVRLEVGDMRKLDLAETYSLAIIPFRPFQHMHTLDDQLAALTSIKKHLRKDGRLVLDVFYPKFEKLTASIGKEILELSWKTEDGHTVERYFRKNSLDMTGQRFSGAMIYRTYRDGELIAEEDNELSMSFFTYPQMQTLFKLARFEVINVFGTFDRKPLQDDSPEMIFELKPE